MSLCRTVFVVDDDATLRRSVGAMVASMGCRAEEYASAEAFLAAHTTDRRGVVVADLRMPGMSGLDLQAELARRGAHLPVIVLTAFARTATTVRAMQAGAVTTIDKPYHDDDLWNAIRAAFDAEETRWLAAQRRREVLARVAGLTPEERRVADLLVAGRPNKAIAHELGMSLRTVEKRRHDAMAKMGAESLPDLVRLFLEVREEPPRAGPAAEFGPS